MIVYQMSPDIISVDKMTVYQISTDKMTGDELTADGRTLCLRQCYKCLTVYITL